MADVVGKQLGFGRIGVADMPDEVMVRRCEANTGTVYSAMGRLCGYPGCEGWAVEGTEPPRCNMHGDGYDKLPAKRRCAVEGCGGWAMRDSEEGLCSVHAGVTDPANCGRGPNMHNLKHGLYARWVLPPEVLENAEEPTAADVVRNAHAKLRLLEDWLFSHLGGLDDQQVIMFYEALGRNAERLMGMLDKQRALEGPSEKSFEDVLGEALDRVWEEYPDRA